MQKRSPRPLRHGRARRRCPRRRRSRSTLAGPAQAATAWPATSSRPYVDTGLSNTTLTTVAADYGTKYFTLAFVDGSGCAWSLPNESGWQSQISSLQAEGGDVSISFGGYTTDTDATDLGATCSSASAMATQVESVVTTLGVTHLDFDIESNELTDSTDYTRTAQALADVRSWASSQRPSRCTIAYTIPALPSGLTSARHRGAGRRGRQRLHARHRQHHDDGLRHVRAPRWAPPPTRRSTPRRARWPARSASPARRRTRMLGNTPMIGQNDSSGEIFTLADASTVESLRRVEGHRAALVLVRGPRQRRLPGSDLRQLHL